ncbi:MAG TPA: amylo-alpha-1,6-glucosidase [Verrucomicrobiae bacterium]|nr:amylo-alpha-1,6-glucosidase [Verrucomicrobiae bacterium]
MTDGREWLEADGLGGFASGTVGGVRSRRYHALLLAAARPPVGRFVLVNGLEAIVTTTAGTTVLQPQRYRPGGIHPMVTARLDGFRDDPWPTWRFTLEDGTIVEQQLFVRRGSGVTALSWKRIAGEGKASLAVRLFLSGRDYHALHHENPAFRFESVEAGPGHLVWRPYDGVPGIAATHNGAYDARPDWYRGFQYDEEKERGLDHVEDLATPGLFHFDLAQGEAVLLLSAETQAPDGPDARSALQRLRAGERARRQAFPSRLHRSAEDYLVRRGEGASIIAGYPWFADWGRDTFIALRGLCLATGRLETARRILLEWAGSVSEGMLPNRFPDQGDEPEYNAVDASLWYVVAVHEFLRASSEAGESRSALIRAVAAIVSGYARGTRYGIRMDDDGLLAAGSDGVQLTWMDARVGEHVVTPRRGKPVEVQALWINALRIAAELGLRPDGDWRRAAESFQRRFWNPERGCLYDVIDVDQCPGAVDDTLRPNQIFAVGGLPWPVIAGETARRVVDVVEAALCTPLGLRSLEPGARGYAPRYLGGVAERDGVYHRGTVWPWLLGPFVEAWVRVRGSSPLALRQARARFLLPLTEHLAAAGLGHVSEIADGDAPHAPRGCPFQAWSVGEVLRLSEQVLAEKPARRESSARAVASITV